MPSKTDSPAGPARRNWVLTPRRRAAMLRNLQKANRSVIEGRRPFTQAMLAASRRNLARGRAVLKARGRSPGHAENLRNNMAKARAARSFESVIRQARSITWHGFYARLLRDTAQALGENPADYDKLHKLIAQYLNPRGAEEIRLARLLGDALWRFHRLYLAQARQQLAALLFYLEKSPPLKERYASHLEDRSYSLVNVLLDQKIFQDRERRLIRSIERLLRRLIRLRGGSRRAFQTNLRPRDDLDQLLDHLGESLDRQWNLIMKLSGE